VYRRHVCRRSAAIVPCRKNRFSRASALPAGEVSSGVPCLAPFARARSSRRRRKYAATDSPAVANVRCSVRTERLRSRASDSRGNPDVPPTALNLCLPAGG
jgi:hypothetical protein